MKRRDFLESATSLVAFGAGWKATPAFAQRACPVKSPGMNTPLKNTPLYPGSSWYEKVSGDNWIVEDKTAFYRTHFLAGLKNEGGGNHYENFTQCVLGRSYCVVDSTKQRAVPVRIGPYAAESNIAWAPLPLREDIISGYPYIWNPGDPDTVATDRHVIVLDEATGLEYNLWGARLHGYVWSCANMAIFDMREKDLQRRWNDTGGDAAGVPLSVGLIRGEEIAAGRINHALRMTMHDTSPRMRPPAQHCTTSWGDESPPMGQRVRLRADYKWPDADFPIPSAAQVIIECLQTYGAIICDNGTNFGITGTPDYDLGNAITARLEQNVRSEHFEWIRPKDPYFVEYPHDAKFPTEKAPDITLKVLKAPLAPGDEVELSWSRKGEGLVCLGEGGVSRKNSDTYKVYPSRDTWYIAQAINAFGNVTKHVRVLVPNAPNRYPQADVYVSPHGSGRMDGTFPQHALPFRALFVRRYAELDISGDFAGDTFLAGRVLQFENGHYDLSPFVDHARQGQAPQNGRTGDGRVPVLQCVGGVPGMPTVYQAETNGQVFFHLPGECVRGAMGAYSVGHVQIVGITVVGGARFGFTFEGGPAGHYNTTGFVLQSCAVRGISDGQSGEWTPACAVRMETTSLAVVRDLNVTNCNRKNGLKYPAVGTDGCSDLYIRGTTADANIIARHRQYGTTPSTVDDDAPTDGG